MKRTEHWSELSPNPISPAAMSYVDDLIRTRFRGPVCHLEQLLDALLPGKSVLDIGVVEHDVSFIGRSGWKHDLLRQRASKIVGVDIVQDAVALLRDRGYDVRLCDATSDDYLGEKFDLVFAGDVIEHVDDPVRLLKFAERHVVDGGKIIVTTPCPYWWRNIRNMLNHGTFMGNVDHVRWVCPTHAVELASRARLLLSDYYTLEPQSTNSAKRFITSCVARLLGKTELFAWAYVYIFERRPAL